MNKSVFMWIPSVILAAAVSPAHATFAVTDINTIIGVFSDPVLGGNVLNYPAPGELTYIDNSATAVTTGSGTNSLTWGSTYGSPQATGNFSSLTFSGAANLPFDSITPTSIGTITYYNGTSSLNTLIFGATLSFYMNSVSAANLLGSDTVYINTTSNQYSGTGLTPTQLQTDADYVNICGNSSNICQSSIESYESTEVLGYSPLVVDLMATYQGDPSITLTSVNVDASTPNSGVVGNLSPLSIPEPTTLALLGLGFAGLAKSRRWVKSL